MASQARAKMLIGAVVEEQVLIWPLLPRDQPGAAQRGYQSGLIR
jgi:hypothetical protein